MSFKSLAGCDLAGRLPAAVALGLDLLEGSRLEGSGRCHQNLGTIIIGNGEGYKGNLPPLRHDCLSFAGGLRVEGIHRSGRAVYPWTGSVLRAGYDSEVTVAVFGR